MGHKHPERKTTSEWRTENEMAELRNLEKSIEASKWH